MNKKVNNTVVLYLAVRQECEHTHASEREPYKLGEHTHRKKTYMPQVMGVGSPIPFQEAESFSYGYMPYIVGVTTTMLFETLMKKYGYGQTHNTGGRGVY